MYVADIKNSVQSLPGIGPAAASRFAHLNIYSIGDLLQFYPRDYEDRTKLISLADYKQHQKIFTIAKVIGHEWFGYGHMKTLKLIITDNTAQAEVIAFNRNFLQQSCPVNSIILILGSFSIKYGKLQSSFFEITQLSDKGNIEDFQNKPLQNTGINPIYPLTEGLSQKIIKKAIRIALKSYTTGLQNEIPDNIIKKRNLLSKKRALFLIHQPQKFNDIQVAKKTLIYEELFHFQCNLIQRSFNHKGFLPNFSVTLDSTIKNKRTISLQDFIKFLSPRQKKLLHTIPFNLTNDQMKVITEMNTDIDKGYKERAAIIKKETLPFHPVFTMSRLLQGDVGSGKTLTAFFACLRVIDWGGQCAFMAPTELLARQHAENAAELLEPINVKVAFFTGSISSRGRKELCTALKNGSIDIAVGTHALFSKDTEYKDLQLAIIDEQHKFGVLQRNAILHKGIQEEVFTNRNDTQINTKNKITFAPHLLMMSATPIPQSMALTVFGDLDISTIKTLPSGRKTIKTFLAVEGHENNVYEAVRSELKKGHQAYFVYPAIQIQNEIGNHDSSNYFSSEKGNTLKSAQEMFSFLTTKIYPEYTCALIHSKISEEEQNKTLSEFKKGIIQVIVATTVVEVGVDVGNATCMVIEQADHFGLAQLHQLRGRVGRNSEQSYCFLIYSKNISKTGIQRMKVLRENTDGFIIAEEDLKLRGPGELTGTVQSGNLELSLADFTRDHDILIKARKDALIFMQHKLQVTDSE